MAMPYFSLRIVLNLGTLHTVKLLDRELLLKRKRAEVFVLCNWRHDTIGRHNPRQKSTYACFAGAHQHLHSTR
jgi:hypothetical protein